MRLLSSGSKEAWARLLDKSPMLATTAQQPVPDLDQGSWNLVNDVLRDPC